MLYRDRNEINAAFNTYGIVNGQHCKIKRLHTGDTQFIPCRFISCNYGEHVVLFTFPADGAWRVGNLFHSPRVEVENLGLNPARYFFWIIEARDQLKVGENSIDELIDDVVKNAKIDRQEFIEAVNRL